jgi:MFS family permease
MKLIFFVCIAEIFSLSSIMYFPALLPDFQAEWGITNTEAGWINGIFYGGYAALVPLLVSLTDRVDPRRIFLLSSALGTASMIGFGWFAQGTWTAATFRLLAGISVAGIYMPGLKTLSDRITVANQSRGISFYTASFGIGTALSVFLTGLLANWIGWRWAAEIIALGPLTGFLLFAFSVKPGKLWSPDEKAMTAFWDLRPAIRNRSAVGYMLGYAVHCWGLFGFRSWLVAFLFFSLSLQPEVSYKFGLQNIATLIILAGVPASILGNEGALRWGRRRVINTIMLISGLLGIVIGFSAGLPFMIVVGLCFVYCIFVMLDSGSLAAGMVSAARAHERGRTMAVYSFLGFCMAFLAPLAVGGVLDIVGNGIVGWGFAFASLGLVEITGPVWLRLFPSGVET